MCLPCFFTISTAEVGVIERWGKYSRLVQPGLNIIFCPQEQMVGRLSFRVQQLDVRVETKTLDNVFLTAVVSVQYQIIKEKVYDGEFGNLGAALRQEHRFANLMSGIGFSTVSRECFY
jgi:regulator of protease activity HflC (stomatin/prohibitin superfamily)